MATKGKHKFDNLWIGFAIGTIIPIVALLFFYYGKYRHLDFSGFLNYFIRMGILTHIVSLSVIPNLLVFFMFIRKDYLYSARGTLMATFFFAFVILGIRLFA